MKLQDILQQAGKGMLLLLSLGAAAVWADDTEIYLTTSGSAGQPNILFMLDTSGSMKLGPDGNVLTGSGEENNPNSRYQIMKRVLTDVLAVAPDKINVGLINYGGHKVAAQANGPKYPITALNAQTRTELEETVGRLQVDGYTPIVQSLYESAQYFTGGKVDYGNSSNVPQQPNPKTYDGTVTYGSNSETVKIECMLGVPPAVGNWWPQCQRPKEAYDSCQIKEGPQCGKRYCPPDYVDLSSCYLMPAVRGGCTNKTRCAQLDEAGNCLRQETYQHCWPDIPAREVCKTKAEVCTLEEVLEGQIQRIDAQYISPIKQECQDNYLVILSDGEPDDGIEPGSDTEVVSKLGMGYGVTGCKDLGDGTCGPEFTEYLATKDQSPLEGDQVIKTYAVGFAVAGEGQDYLRELANLGDTDNADHDAGFFTAANEKQLKDIFQLIVEEIAVENHSLAIPSISVDPKTGLTNGNEVYLPLFRPSNLPRWLGNIKKYGLALQGGQPQVVDANGDPINDANGRPIASSRSLWLPADDPADGGDITAGGAARLLGTQRKLWVNDLGDSLVPLTEGNVKPEWLGLTDTSTVSKTALMRFVRGLDETQDQPLQEMGDILHSNPTLVSYGEKTVLYVGTNEGFLHAFDTNTGQELFAFMPRELLKNAATRYDNSFGEPHVYGLDGPISIWRDTQGNKAEKVYLYVGMRRGGKNYYALDITDPKQPKLAWVIRGGEGQFAALGQTWSKAIPATVELGNAQKDVLIFGGGYDTAQDAADTRGDDAVGNAVFIVDARTGERLWWTSRQNADLDLPAMRNSIPANVRVIDIDTNGVADRLYVADTGGRIFRLDLVDKTNTFMTGADQKTSASGVLFADLGGGGVANHRRFYYEPDAAIISHEGRHFVSLAIGSGFRAHPLTKGDAAAQNRLYVLKDPGLSYVLNEANHSYFIESDLADLTDPTDTGSEDITVDDKSQNGWYVSLDRAAGEKALARAVTLKNTVYFTTFEPETVAAKNVCSAASHTGRVYGLNIVNAEPALKFVDVTEPQRVESYGTKDIPSEVLLVASRYEYKKPNSDETVQGDGVTFHVMVDQLDRYLQDETFVGLNKWYWEEVE